MADAQVEGLVVRASSHDPVETMRRLIEAVTARGLTVLAHVDHAAAAAKAGLALRPTDLLIFGNPKGGTPLMQAVQTMGIDLPLKALVWQDAEGKTWLGHNDPAWLARRHGVQGQDERLAAMDAALDALVASVTG
jgi:uncharacterized protein (DUF302 family)